MLTFFTRRPKVTATRTDGTTFWVSINNDPALTFTVTNPEQSKSVTEGNKHLAALEPATQRDVIKAIHRAGNNSHRSGASNVALVVAVALLGLVSLASLDQRTQGQPTQDQLATSQQCSIGPTQFDPSSLGLNAEELDAINTQSQGLTELKAMHRDLQTILSTQGGDLDQPNNTVSNRASEYEFGY